MADALGALPLLLPAAGDGAAEAAAAGVDGGEAATGLVLLLPLPLAVPLTSPGPPVGTTVPRASDANPFVGWYA